MNVIRQDVVQIDFKTNATVLNNLNKSINQIQASISKVNPTNVTKPLSNMGKSANNVSRATQKFQSLNRAIQTGGNKIQQFKSSIKNLPSNAINKISTGFVKLRLQSALAVGSLKAVAQTKFNNLKTDIQATKKALTGGTKGVQGFKNALKNIGKISVAKVTSGLGKIRGFLSRGSPLATKFGGSLRNIARTSLEKLKSGLKTVGSHLTTIAKKAGGAAFKALKKVAGVSFKALSVGMAGVAAGVGTLVAKSVSAYADYEQLVGGVETLLGAQGAKSVQEYAKLTGKSVSAVKGEYGKLMKSQNTVIKNANNAYKTAGLSANEYMESVTGFSASLLQSVGGDTQKAAKLADVAISDMADNANKMGTDMQSIQYAYQGFAKQNYTINYLMSAA